ncbi:DUF5710 domain-containing protein [Stenotrophomonas maltophilia]|uniref:DUF5710 domain-containing protein n=1 Tax=Stenotrophomonas maltophilia TaxID=40324 RepID=UPI0039C2EC46
MLVGKITKDRDIKILQRAVDRYEEVTIDPNTISVVESRFLDVPLDQEEDAIRAGANYDSDIRCFVVPETVDLQPFKQWFPRVEADLLQPKDTKNYLTKSGRPLESYRLKKDSVIGVASLAMPLMYAALPVVAALAFFVFQITGSIFLSVPALFLSAPYLITIYQKAWASQSEVMKAAVLLLIFPYAIATCASIGGIASLLTLGTLTIILPIWILFFGILPFAFGKGLHFEKSRKLWMTVNVSAILISVTLFAAVCFTINHGFGSLASSLIFASAALYALHYSSKEARIRAADLADFSNVNSMSRYGSERGAMQIQKARQAKASVEDQSLRFQVGQSKGVLSKKGYALSPGAGANMHFSANDSGRGTVVLGSTGSGKTIFLNNIVASVLVNNIVFDLTHQDKNSTKNGGDK